MNCKSGLSSFRFASDKLRYFYDDEYQRDLSLPLSFQEKLYSWVENKGLSRKDLIAILHNKYYEEFKGLDLVTLSRWLKGRSTPPLYKQLYIAKCLDINIKELVGSLDVSKVKYPSKYDAIVFNLMRSLDFSLSVLSYNNIPKYVKSEISSLTYKEHNELFGDFYNNVSALKKFNCALNNLNSNIDYIGILIRNENEGVIGHWSGILDINKINGISSFITIPEDELCRSFLVFLGCYANSKQYFELIVQAICFYLIAHVKSKDFVYFHIVNNRPMVEFCKRIFNAEEVRYYAPLDERDKMGVFLLKFNIIKSISNPVILKNVQERLKCLDKCGLNLCNLCNLKDIEQRF